MGNNFSLSDYDDGSSSTSNVRNVQKSVNQVSHVLSLAVQEGTTRLEDLKNDVSRAHSDLVLLESQIVKISKRPDVRTIDSATAARFDVLEEKMDKLDSKFSDIHLVLSRLAKRDEIMRNALFAADEEEEAPLKKVGIRRPRNVPSALPNK